MSRPPRSRGAGIGDRLAETLQDDLADIASTIGWIDSQPPVEATDPVAPEPGPAGFDLAEGGQAADGFDLLLDDFASAVDAMFEARDHSLKADPAQPEPACLAPGESVTD